MRNSGQIHIDNGYPDSEDCESNMISSYQQQSSGNDKTLMDVRIQMLIEKLNASELPSPGTSALCFARFEETGILRLGHYFFDAFESMTRLPNKWLPQRTP